MRLLVRILCALVLNSTIKVQAQWIQTSGPTPEVPSLATHGGKLFAAAYAGGGSLAGVYASADSGTTWTRMSSGLTTDNFDVINVFGDRMFACAVGKIFMSPNDALNWIDVTPSMLFGAVSSLAAVGGDVFMGTYGWGIFRTPDSGATWTQINAGQQEYDLATVNTTIFAATSGSVLRSTDFGASWTQTGTTTFLRLKPVGLNLFAADGIDGSVYRSTNLGTAWVPTNTGLPPIPNVSAIGSDGTNVFVGTYDGGVFVSTNNGSSWRQTSEGLPSGHRVYSFAVVGPWLFVSSNGIGVWRRRLSETITSVGGEHMRAREFQLQQNYPNPFNPSTEIGFRIANFGLVTLKVYDLLGREVATLVNEVKQPGTYTVQFEGSHLASGVYLNRLMSGQFVATRKLLLLK